MVLDRMWRALRGFQAVQWCDSQAADAQEGIDASDSVVYDDYERLFENDSFEFHMTPSAVRQAAAKVGSSVKTVAAAPKNTMNAAVSTLREQQQRIERQRKRLAHKVKKQRVMLSPSLQDRLSFLVGIANLSYTAYWFGSSPETFHVLYSFKFVALMLLRLYLYRQQKYHYFMFDFCYFANFWLLIFLHVTPTSRLLFQALFAAAHGPLLMAILTWRNSLVFHSLDKTTSVFIHLGPAMVLWCLRMYPARLPAYRDAVCPGGDCDALGSTVSFFDVSIWPLVPYLLWQFLYYVVVDVWRVKRVEERGYATSFNYLKAHQKDEFSQSLLRILGPGREKFSFMLVQFVYTVLTFLPLKVYLMYPIAHTTWVIAAYLACIWNGANYYFEVFSKRYVEAATKKREQLMREIADEEESLKKRMAEREKQQEQEQEQQQEQQQQQQQQQQQRQRQPQQQQQHDAAASPPSESNEKQE